MSDATHFDNAGWARFARDNWERLPCKLACEPPLTPESAFAAALASADHERSTKEVVHQITVDGNYACEPRSMDFLARAGDETLAAYLARIRKLAMTGAFRVIHHKLQARAGWQVWNGLVRLLQPIFEHAGFPYGGIEALLVVGADESFLPALQTWTKWAPDARKSGHLVFAITGGARVAANDDTIELAPGELAYIPATARNAAALVGSSAVLVINITAGSAEERATRMVRELILKSNFPQIIACRHELVRTAEQPHGVPPALAVPATELLATARSALFAEQLQAGWLCLETGLAFTLPPPPDPDARITKHMQVRAGATLRWTTTGERLLAAANGHALKFPIHPSVISLLDELTSGRCATVASLVERFSTDEDGPGPEDLYELLQQLHAIRAIERVVD